LYESVNPVIGNGIVFPNNSILYAANNETLSAVHRRKTEKRANIIGDEKTEIMPQFYKFLQPRDKIAFYVGEKDILIRFPYGGSDADAYLKHWQAN
jgi:hypothetical protein